MNIPPALQYFGSKHRNAPRIIAQFPQHELYCEVFGGGASVLLQKQPAPFEVYNDLSGDVVNFFKMLRSRPDELIRAIELTPYSRLEFEQSYEFVEDKLERARHFYVRIWQGFSSVGSTDRVAAWGYLHKKPQGGDLATLQHLTARNIYGLLPLDSNLYKSNATTRSLLFNATEETPTR